MDLDYLVKRHEREFENKKYVYIANEVNRTLIVAMSTHNFGENYYMLRGLCESCECSLLFITDPINSYYLEEDQGASYQRLLQKFVKKYGCENITLFGSSMSGYGALFHSLELNTNAIVSNPQIDFKSSFDNAWSDLQNTLRKVEKNWVNINDKITSMQNVNVQWFCAYGDNQLDAPNIKKLREVVKPNLRVTFQNIKDDTHGFYFKNKDNVFLLHRLMVEMRRVKISS